MTAALKRTASELFKAKAITNDELLAAVDAYLTDQVGPSAYASGHPLDLAAAIEAHGPAANADADSERLENFGRGMIRTAILLARPATS